jgi:alanine dehydrogenase/PNT-like protein
VNLFTRKARKVLVMGAGPAGLLAAHAANRLGYEVTVFSAPDKTLNRPAKSELYGCQYLHERIPELGLGEGRAVHYDLTGGSPTEYRVKVYGSMYAGKVSPDEFGPEAPHQAWDLRQAYNELWKHWGKKIVPIRMTPEMGTSFGGDPNTMKICTIPAPVLCRRPEEHKFLTQDVWAMGSAPGNILPYVAPDMTVQCNAADAPRWYRAATVFGQSTLEWPQGAKPPITGVAAVSKPLSTDCDCHVGKRWMRVGRFGKWTKGVLAHTAYYETMEKLQ